MEKEYKITIEYKDKKSIKTYNPIEISQLELLSLIDKMEQEVEN